MCELRATTRDFKIIYEDPYFLVLDKPAGFVVNDATTTHGQDTVQGFIEANLDFPISKDRSFRNGIVHRLDKDTSGILLIAKTSEMFFALQSLFKEREIHKEYLALLHNVPKTQQGTIDVPIGRLPWHRERFGVFSGGRDAVTEYKVESQYIDAKKSRYSLVRFFPKTGRTHQIRVHAKYLGCPIVADMFYAGRKTARHDKAWCPRLWLHAAAISFDHPMTHEPIHLECDLPDDIKNPLMSLARLDADK